MKNYWTSLFGPFRDSVKIFEGVGAPQSNFRVVATNVRPGQPPKNYVLDDGEKLAAIVDKWRFEPGGVLSRCGYDYQIVLTNGELSIPVSVCFLCNTLIVNHSRIFKTSRKQIRALLEADFRPL
ncbi:MAG TPA: hypothetical protein PKH43_03740 [Saprospiraceae bacterium]|nr:hypothetical protein [Saprospiraceae bacterium]